MKIIWMGVTALEYDGECIHQSRRMKKHPILRKINTVEDLCNYLMKRISLREDAVKLHAYRTGMDESEVKNAVNEALANKDVNFLANLACGVNAVDDLRIVV